MASPKLQEKLEHLKARLKGLHAKIGGGLKGSAFAVGTGAIGYYAADMAVQKVEFLQKDYVLPAVLIIGGHLIKRKQYDIGTALMAIGAFLGAQTFKTNSEKDKGSTTSTTTTVPAMSGSPAGVSATGLDGGNAGWNMMERAGDSGALQSGRSTSQEPQRQLTQGLGDAGAIVHTSEVMNLRD